LTFHVSVTLTCCYVSFFETYKYLIKLHTVKGTEKRAVENKIKIYNDYQSAGLITFLISSTQHLPPAVIIEKQKYQ